MISTQGQRELSLLCMPTNSFRHSLSNFRHQTWVLQLSNGRVRLGGDVLELVMSVKLDLPSKLRELLDETCVDKMNRTFVDTNPRLQKRLDRLL